MKFGQIKQNITMNYELIKKYAGLNDNEMCIRLGWASRATKQTRVLTGNWKIEELLTLVQIANKGRREQITIQDIVTRII